MSKLHTYHFPFLSGELKIEFVNNINEDLAEGIADLISILKNDLNPRFLNSSAHTLKISGLQLPVTVSPEFMEFFELNLKYFSVTKSEFTPFKKEVNKFELSEYFLIDNQSNVMVKKKNFEFDSSLQKFFVIQKINDFLQQNQIKNYYFNYVDIAASFGTVRWNASFKFIEDEQDLKFKLHNNFGYFFIPQTQTDVGYAKFANIDKKINAKYIIFIGKNLTDLKILSLEAAHLVWLHQFKAFKEENNIEIIIYTKEETITV